MNDLNQRLKALKEEEKKKNLMGAIKLVTGFSLFGFFCAANEAYTVSQGGEPGFSKGLFRILIIVFEPIFGLYSTAALLASLGFLPIVLFILFFRNNQLNPELDL